VITEEQVFKAFQHYGTDKLYLHDYVPMYTYMFNRIPPITKILEVGILDGRSLAAWVELFPTAEIAGVDIKDRRVPKRAAHTKRYIGDSTDPSVANIVGTGYDVIIDDGSHDWKDQIKTFDNLESCWKHSYVVEDIYGIRRMNMIIDHLKQKGYNNLVEFKSKEEFVFHYDDGEEPMSFYSLVVYPKS
jgi:hypothetical protein